MSARYYFGIAAVIIAMLVLVEAASAHSWYTRTNCCNGTDCAPVPLDASWVTLEEKGYHIQLTAEQAKLVNPDASQPVNLIIPWGNSRIRVPPPLRPGETYGPNVYHLCIAPTGNTVYCLFVVPGV